MADMPGNALGARIHASIAGTVGHVAPDILIEAEQAPSPVFFVPSRLRG